MQDCVPSPGFEPVAPALGAQSLSHWTTREVCKHRIIKKQFLKAQDEIIYKLYTLNILITYIYCKP